jgi:hypothetical protein
MFETMTLDGLRDRLMREADTSMCSAIQEIIRLRVKLQPGYCELRWSDDEHAALSLNGKHIASLSYDEDGHVGMIKLKKIAFAIGDALGARSVEVYDE